MLVSVYGQDSLDVDSNKICLEREVAIDLIVIQDSLQHDNILKDSLLDKTRSAIVSFENKFLAQKELTNVEEKYKHKYRRLAAKKIVENKQLWSYIKYGAPALIVIWELIRRAF